MPAYVRTRLSAMMFLFYFALGSWAVTLSTYLMSAPVKGGLNFTTAEVGWVYSTFAIGGVTAPLFVGLLADRLFPVERILRNPAALPHRADERDRDLVQLRRLVDVFVVAMEPLLRVVPRRHDPA